MDLRTIARLTGVLGGLCWVVRWVLDLTGTGDDGMLDAFQWVGLGLLAVSLAGYGAGLVSRSATWLRVIVAVAFPLLVWSVLEVLRDAGDAVLVDFVVGGGVLLVSAVGLARGGGPEPEDQPRRAHGAHSR